MYYLFTKQDCYQIKYFHSQQALTVINLFNLKPFKKFIDIYGYWTDCLIFKKQTILVPSAYNSNFIIEWKSMQSALKYNVSFYQADVLQEASPLIFCIHSQSPTSMLKSSLWYDL
jgi:hypothetical protein